MVHGITSTGRTARLLWIDAKKREKINGLAVAAYMQCQNMHLHCQVTLLGDVARQVYIEPSLQTLKSNSATRWARFRN